MQCHSVIGGGGLKLHVREWGRGDGPPLVFLHGWSQSHLSWRRQYESALADRFRIVACDLRGHGMSDAPLERREYADGEKWADDVAAILEQLNLTKPILIGWSYAGCVICDYLRKYGDRQIAGINFVAAAAALGRNVPEALTGTVFAQHARAACAGDLPTNISAMRSFLRDCLGTQCSADDFEVALAAAMVVDPKIRGFLLRREESYESALNAITVPVLVTHNRKDRIVPPAMSDHILRHCKTASASWYPSETHAPFFEASLRFNTELSDFAGALAATLRNG